MREIAERVAASSGLEIVEVEFLGGGKARMLRVFLISPAGIGMRSAGVTHEDCANFSREFGTILDVEDAMPGSRTRWKFHRRGWIASCSRPADFERFTGSRVKLTTRHPVNGTTATLKGGWRVFKIGRLTLDLSVASQQVAQEDGRGEREHARKLKSNSPMWRKRIWCRKFKSSVVPK